MNVPRRRLLSSAAGVALGALAGCTRVGSRLRTVEVGEDSYPQPFYDAGNTNNPDTTALTSSPKVYWRHSNRGEGIPLVGNRHVYLEKGVLRQQTGEVDWPADEETWTRQMGHPGGGGPIGIDDTRVYFTNLHVTGAQTGVQGVHAIDPETGTQQWSIEIGEMKQYGTLVDDRVFVCGSPDESEQTRVFGLGTASGDVVWEFSPEESLNSPPAVVGGIVYVSSDEGRVYAVDATDETVLWMFTPNEKGSFFQTESSFSQTPVVANGTVFVGQEDGTLYALDASEGIEQWTRSLSTENGGRRTEFTGHNTLATDGDVVYANAGDGLFALDAATGEELWARHGRFSVGPTLVQNTLYLGALDLPREKTGVVALDASSGETRWRFATRGRSQSDVVSSGDPSLPVVVDGYVYVCTGAEDVYALGK